MEQVGEADIEYYEQKETINDGFASNSRPSMYAVGFAFRKCSIVM